MNTTQIYERARKDFEVLEAIKELEDEAELDSERLSLMQNPTEEYATKLYHYAIELWFRQTHPDFKDNDIVRAIETRHQYYVARNKSQPFLKCTQSI